MAKNPTPNLFAVGFTLAGAAQDESLWIIAANERTAATKARRVLRARGEKLVRLTAITWEGTIDAL